MFNIGSFRANDCHSLTRRAFVGMAAAAPFACASAAPHAAVLPLTVVSFSANPPCPTDWNHTLLVDTITEATLP
jgi:hypothetical protein